MLSELLLAALLAAPPAEPVLLERVVAVVDGRPVLWSDLLVAQALKPRPLEQAREAVIDELLMAREASRLAEARPTAEEEARAVDALRGQAPGAPEPVLRAVARRQLLVLAYLARRFRPLVRVTDEEVLAAIDIEWPEPAERPPLASAVPAMRSRLEQEQLDALVEQWIADLRGVAQVRRLGLGAEGPSGPAR